MGVPTEVKEDERRVALTPDGVREMEAHGVEVLVQAGAGEGASIPDEAYKAAGAEIVADAAEVWARAGMVVKVKEPQASEFEHLRPDLTLFTYLHLAAYPKVAQALCDAGTTGIAYETVMRADGALPLLAPMSEVAGRLAVQAGARFLEAPQGGRGVLLGGAPGVQPARVVVIGAGNVGWNSAWIAAGMEAEVNLLDKNLDRLRFVDQIHKGRITTLASNRGTVERCIAEADLVIGAVLVAGGRAPVVITEPMVGHHEAGRGDRRRGHRPGRLRGDVPRDHPPRPHLRGARRRPLLRRQHARRGAGHVHPRAHQRHAPLPRGGGGARRHRGLPQGPRAGPGPQHRGRSGGERGGGRGAGRAGRHAEPRRRLDGRAASSTTPTRRSSALSSSTAARRTRSSARRSACRRRRCASACSA